MENKNHQSKNNDQEKVVDRKTQEIRDERKQAVEETVEKALQYCRVHYSSLVEFLYLHSKTTAVILGKTTPVNYPSYLKLEKGEETLLSTFIRSMHRLFGALNYLFFLDHELDMIGSAVKNRKYVVMLENIPDEDLHLYPESSHYFVHSKESQELFPYPIGKVSKEERKLLIEQSEERADTFILDRVSKFAHDYYQKVDISSLLVLDEKSFISHSSFNKLFNGKRIRLTTFLRTLSSFLENSCRKFCIKNRNKALKRAIARGTSIVLQVVSYAELRKYDNTSYFFV